MKMRMHGRKDRITKPEGVSLNEFSKPVLPGTVQYIPSRVWYVQIVPLLSQSYSVINF